MVVWRSGGKIRRFWIWEVDVSVDGAVRGGGGFGYTLSWPAVVARRKGAADLQPSKASIDDDYLRGAICGSSSSSSNTRTACLLPRSSAGMAATLQPPVWRTFLQAAGAQRLVSSKWFVPGGPMASSGDGGSLDLGVQAYAPCSSAATP